MEQLVTTPSRISEYIVLARQPITIRGGSVIRRNRCRPSIRSSNSRIRIARTTISGYFRIEFPDIQRLRRVGDLRMTVVPPSEMIWMYTGWRGMHRIQRGRVVHWWFVAAHMSAELTPHCAPVGRRRARQLAVVVVGDHISCLRVGQVSHRPSWKEPGDGEGVGGTGGKMVRVQRVYPSGSRTTSPH